MTLDRVLLHVLAVLLFAAAGRAVAQSPAPAPPPTAALVYVKRDTRDATRDASLEATRAHIGTLHQGPWHHIGPFDNAEGRGARTPYPPEEEIRLDAGYIGADRRRVSWAELKNHREGKSNNLDLYQRLEFSLCYLTRTVTCSRDRDAVLRVGSDDSITVWVNGNKVHEFIGQRGMPRVKDRVPIRLRQGDNRILLKVGNLVSAWQFWYDLPELDEAVLDALEARLDEDFPSTHEASFYRLETIEPPEGVVLEVGGLCHLPDGTLRVGTRRGDIWTVKFDSPDNGRWSLFASGLHEPLGLWIALPGEPGVPEGAAGVYTIQRPELTLILDTDGDGRADVFDTVCDAWGISGNYHEFAFGPERDAEGNFWGTLNLAHADDGFGEMASIAPWRGWSFKVTPRGEFVPWSSGLRSPAGVGVSPDGDAFFTENQGGYVGTSFMAHMTRGAFHGHPAGLKWDKAFPLDPAKATIEELDRLRKRPSILFPHGPMGHSPGQPVWDTTGGKFGPFAGHVFVGDQTKSFVSRVTLEKVGGEFQGACYPFRAGTLSGVIRLAFAPDGSLVAGQTDRGWGSIGGHPWGLQRITWTGRVPFEIHTMSLAKDGFTLAFTKPVDASTAADPAAYSLQHYHYLYQQAYGSPQIAVTPVAVKEVRISEDRRTVSLVLPSLAPQKVYELHLRGVRGEDGAEPLHDAAYYTLNQTLPR
jgi:hypothetical protein